MTNIFLRPKRRIRFSMRASVRRKDNIYDNIPMECFWGAMKNEFAHPRSYLCY